MHEAQILPGIVYTFELLADTTESITAYLTFYNGAAVDVIFGMKVDTLPGTISCNCFYDGSWGDETKRESVDISFGDTFNLYFEDRQVKIEFPRINLFFKYAMRVPASAIKLVDHTGLLEVSRTLSLGGFSDILENSDSTSIEYALLSSRLDILERRVKQLGTDNPIEEPKILLPSPISSTP